MAEGEEEKAMNIKNQLTWKLTHDSLELKITDTNGRSVVYGNVNGGIEFDDPEVPKLLAKAIDALNAPHELPPTKTP